MSRSALAFAVTLAAAAPAFAQVAVLPTQAQEASDELTLRDGTVLRGHVSTIRPGVSTTIVLHGGEERVVPAADIASARGPAYANMPSAGSAAPTGAPGTGATSAAPTATPALPPPPPPPPPAADPSDFSQPAAGRVPLVVTSTGRPLRVGVMVQTAPMITAYGVMYGQGVRSFCETPCTLYVRPGDFSLHTSGEGLRSSLTDLDVPAQGLRVRIRASSEASYGTGLLLVTAGALALVAGGVVLFMAPGTSDAGLWVGGGLLSAAGLAAVIPGGLLVAGNQTGIEASGPQGRDHARGRAGLRLAVAPELLPGGGALVGALEF